MTNASIRISRELREFLGAEKSHPRESYDMVIRRKLARKRNLRRKVSKSFFRDPVSGLNRFGKTIAEGIV